MLLRSGAANVDGLASGAAERAPPDLPGLAAAAGPGAPPPPTDASSPGDPGRTRQAWRDARRFFSRRFVVGPGGSRADARRWCPGLSLTAQFSLVGSVVLTIGMLAQGAWISSAIERKAKYNAGTAAALFVDHVVAPYVATLEPGEALSAQQRQAMDGLMRRASSRLHVAAMKVWATDGTIIYSTNAAVVGRAFAPSAAMRSALAGDVVVEFDRVDDEESAWERSMGIPLIEVYVPIPDAAGRVVAIAEFYENATALSHEMTLAKRDAWLITGIVFVGMMGSMLVIVTRGSRLIERQRRALQRKIAELSHLLRQNSLLQDRVERASRLAAVESEQLLHRLGADLHDGPAQLISFALLRLDALASMLDKPAAKAEATADIAAMQVALTDAMSEVRSICAGLSMPRIACLPFDEALRSVIREHKRRTGTAVHSHVVNLPPSTPHFVTASLCRFVQEGLNNAYRHAGGKGQSVVAWLCEGAVRVEVVDEGPGLAAGARPGAHGSLGLAGLANRIEGLGGTMQIRSAPGAGTRLIATMPIVTADGRSDP